MLLHRFWRLWRRLFGPHESLEERIRRIFPPDDQDHAREFYESWIGQDYLYVQFGGGIGRALDTPVPETAEQFFRAGALTFYAEPVDCGAFWSIAWDEDVAGVSLDKETGKVFQVWVGEQGTEFALADSFRDFLLRLQQAGATWR